MKVEVMRAVDRFAGVPLCWITGVWHRVRPHGPPGSDDASHPVLVMKFFGIGSVLLSTPLLDALRRRFPAAPIVYLTFAANRDVLEKLPQPAVRLAVDTGSPLRFVLDTARALRVIRRLKPQVVFDLEFFSKFSTLIAALSGARARIGFELPVHWRRWNITHPVPLDHGAHVTEVFLRQLEALGGGAPADHTVTRLRATAADRVALSRMLPRVEEASERIVVNINAGRTSLERRWPPGAFIEVVRSLARESGRRTFFFTGSEDEREYVDTALAPYRDIAGVSVNCAGRLTIGTLIALLERAALLLTNDSGPMHLAASVGTPVVALFGPESPSLYGPIGNARVISRGLSCSPCLTVYNAKLFICPYDARCMKEITVDEVISAVRQTLPTTHHGDA